MLVRVVEMEGSFTVRRRPRRVTSPPTFPKALIILRAPDGLQLGSALFKSDS
jgi:hypothetical protein